jgi:hypothetical protein
LGQVPESVLDRDQYVCNQVHLMYVFDVAYKFHRVAFDVSHEPLVGLYVHVTFLSGTITLDRGARDCFAERECCAGIDGRFNTNGINKSNLIKTTLWPGSLRLLAGHKTGILHDHDFGGLEQRSNGLALLRPADYEFSGGV